MPDPPSHPGVAEPGAGPHGPALGDHAGWGIPQSSSRSRGGVKFCGRRPVLSA